MHRKVTRWSSPTLSSASEMKACLFLPIPASMVTYLLSSWCCFLKPGKSLRNSSNVSFPRAAIGLSRSSFVFQWCYSFRLGVMLRMPSLSAPYADHYGYREICRGRDYLHPLSHDGSRNIFVEHNTWKLLFNLLLPFSVFVPLCLCLCFSFRSMLAKMLPAGRKASTTDADESELEQAFVENCDMEVSISLLCIRIRAYRPDAAVEYSIALLFGFGEISRGRDILRDCHILSRCVIPILRVRVCKWHHVPRNVSLDWMGFPHRSIDRVFRWRRRRGRAARVAETSSTTRMTKTMDLEGYHILSLSHIVTFSCNMCCAGLPAPAHVHTLGPAVPCPVRLPRFGIVQRIGFSFSLSVYVDAS